MIWKFLVVVTGSESPVREEEKRGREGGGIKSFTRFCSHPPPFRAQVVDVLSGSKEPGFYRGDILFLTHSVDRPVAAGDVVVFSLGGRDIPIVHRAIKVHDGGGGGLQLLTKGDNNWGDDRALYNRGQRWLTASHLMGRVVGFLPHVGRVTIIMNDYPAVKYALIGVLGLFVITSKE